jgi:hypothetical protein
VFCLSTTSMHLAKIHASSADLHTPSKVSFAHCRGDRPEGFGGKPFHPSGPFTDGLRDRFPVRAGGSGFARDDERDRRPSGGFFSRSGGAFGDAPRHDGGSTFGSSSDAFGLRRGGSGGPRGGGGDDYGLAARDSSGFGRHDTTSALTGDDYVGPIARLLAAPAELPSSILLGTPAPCGNKPAGTDSYDDKDDYYKELEQIKLEKEAEQREKEREACAADGSGGNAIEGGEAEDGDILEGRTWEEEAAEEEARAADGDKKGGSHPSGLKPIDVEKWRRQQVRGSPSHLLPCRHLAF